MAAPASSSAPADVIDATPDTGPRDREAVIDRLLKGAIDLHCHSGPSVMPRAIDHYEAMREAMAAGMRGLLFKDHYYSVTPVAQVLQTHFAGDAIRLMSGLALNNTVGGLNRFAVDHAIKLGADLIWMPTFSSANHIAHHRHDKDFEKKFPTPKEKMLAPEELTVLDEAGKLKDEVKFILDLIAEADLVLSSGHLNIREIWPLFEEARARGVARLLCNHPTYVVDATLDDIRRMASMGVFIEHSVCMFVEDSFYKFYSPEELREVIEAGTVDRTILGSDLGQVGNPSPVTGFRSVIGLCLDLGYSEADIRKLVSTNAARLMRMEA